MDDCGVIIPANGSRFRILWERDGNVFTFRSVAVEPPPPPLWRSAFPLKQQADQES